ncbi:twin-arginine translocase TatA/TatE family subunit [Desulfobacula toluolica]|uniref:TatA: twin-arginine translocation protein, TatA/E family subunit n=1 Tax=Desulfobacula toluolica (strain DSM 7467 / Tol2) TaxID=651182 RepID=K0NCX1_DESTT|nr:twin-arginine translocase TatA/TatE family subunit [Desulfobacula toluolica]CCK78731.1 TatA: twin-arginine translocation protein, TatA/E family subunit [Desulfobacula toluolica Tol2]
MFGLGMPEILLILAIALIVIGPQKLPDLAKTLGRAMGEFKRSAQDFKRSIDVETTVKDMTDINTSKTDLKEILKDTYPKEQTSAVKEDKGSQNVETKNSDTATDEIPKDKETTDKEPDKNNNTSENNKND